MASNLPSSGTAPLSNILVKGLVIGIAEDSQKSLLSRYTVWSQTRASQTSADISHLP
jgi:hypothetical protein